MTASSTALAVTNMPTTSTAHATAWSGTPPMRSSVIVSSDNRSAFGPIGTRPRL